MKRMNSRVIAACMAAALVLAASAPAGTVNAAAKPKLATKKIVVKVKESKTIAVKKKGTFKLSFVSKNKKIAVVSKKGKVTGKKKGDTKITVYYQKGKAGKKKLGTVNVKVTAASSGKNTQTPADNATMSPGQTMSPQETLAPTVTAPAVTMSPQNTLTPDIPGETDGPSVPAAETPIPALDPNNLVTVDYPSIFADVPDVDIIRVGGNYYMTSTTMNLCPGVPVMKSTDLVHWEIVNYVYDTHADDDRANLENNKQMYGNGSWAASLKYEDGLYYVAFNTNGQGFYVYTTEDIENGPWIKHHCDPSYHDPALLFDDGKMYVISGTSLVQLELDDEEESIREVGRENITVPTRDNWTLWEGPHAYKIGEYYYLFVIASPQGAWMRTQVCYRSKELHGGTWEEQVVYQGGVGECGAGLAQGGVVQTQYGDWYGFAFQDHQGAGRIPSVVAVKWDYSDDEKDYTDWPMMGSYDEDGNFMPSTAKDSVQINLNDSGTENYFVDSDEFDYSEDKLKLVWQWNHNPQNEFWSVTENPGYLRLKTDRTVEDLYFAHNSLTQRTYGPTCNSEVKISVANMKPGDYAGLASVANHAGMIGVKCDENGDKYIVQSVLQFPNRGQAETAERPMTENAKEALNGATDVYLKIAYNFSANSNNDIADFYYSFDGEDWEKLGKQQSLKFDTNTTFMGTRTWLFNYATEEAGGYVDFDYYHVYD